MHELMHGNCIIHVYPLVSVPKRSLLNNSIKPEFISMQNQNSEKESLQKRKKETQYFSSMYAMAIWHAKSWVYID
jgi:hypothetical protein